MSGWRAVRLVAWREISERLRGSLLRVLTVLSALIVVALIVVPTIISSKQGATAVGLVAPGMKGLGPEIQATAKAQGVRITVQPVDDATDEQSDLTLGTIAVGVRVEGGYAFADVSSGLDSSVQQVIQTALDEVNLDTTLESAGVPTATIQRATSPIPLSVVTVTPQPADQTARAAAAIAAAAILYVSLLVWGGLLAQAVAQEKTSRIAEVLISAITPNQLLTGKVLGIGVCALGQMSVAVAAGLITNALTHSATIPHSVWALLPAALLWFLLGFGFYSLLFATAGVLVARQEEVGLATTPFSFVIVGAYLLTFAAVGSPDASWVRVLSYVPPLAPILMPVRIAVGTLAWWETPAAVLLIVLATLFIARIAGGVYRSSLVRGGPRIPWRIALGWYPGERRLT